MFNKERINFPDSLQIGDLYEGRIFYKIQEGTLYTYPCSIIKTEPDDIGVKIHFEAIHGQARIPSSFYAADFSLRAYSYGPHKGLWNNKNFLVSIPELNQKQLDTLRFIYKNLYQQ